MMASATPAAAADPRQTLVLSNLPDKVRKQEMRKALYLLCSEFGRVLDVVVMKTDKARGRAWIVFGDMLSCNQALQAIDGKFEIYGRKPPAEYAKETSFVVDPSARHRRERRIAQARDEAVTSLASRKRPRV